MVEDFIKVEWWPSDRTTRIRVLIDRPIEVIHPNTLPHHILKFFRDDALLSRLKFGGEIPRPGITPAVVASALNKKRGILLYPLLEKLWAAGLLHKDWEFISSPWWWTKYGQNNMTLEAMHLLDNNQLFAV
jgi:hypothetical protein